MIHIRRIPVKPFPDKEMDTVNDSVQFRYEVEPSDAHKIRQLVTLTGFFQPNEVNVAEELVLEHLAKGDPSGYRFILADHYDRIVGYVCYGPIAVTVSSYDLYWIAVVPEFQRKGLGNRLMKEAENRIRRAGGTRVYVETSRLDQYHGTRVFYEKKGYRLESVLDDYYGPDNAKVTYCKILT